MTFQAALQQADRHCDMEGLPAPSSLALMSEALVIDGSISVDKAISILATFHGRGLAKPENTKW